MPSSRFSRIARKVLLWVTAGAATFLIGFFAVGAVVHVSHGQTAVSFSGTPVGAVLRTIEEGALATLSLAPSTKREVPLVAAMIENHEFARPYQAGLSEATMVFEILVEGEISRFLALFRADNLPPRIGPTRSLRPAFIDAAEAYAPLFLHIGGSAIAYEELAAHPGILHHDGIRFDGETYQRDPLIPPPHNLFMGRDALRTVIADLTGKGQLRPVPFPLYPTESALPRGETAREVKVDFRSPQHNVTYIYDALKQTYLRSIFGAPKQATPANVLILETEVQGLGIVGSIPWTRTFGKGRLLLFTRGVAVQGNWVRGQGERFRFLDHSGKPLPLPPGQAWITFLPSLERVQWK